MHGMHEDRVDGPLFATEMNNFDIDILRGQVGAERLVPNALLGQGLCAPIVNLQNPHAIVNPRLTIACRVLPSPVCVCVCVGSV